MAKFACNNKVQLLTKRTPLFANHCLHHRFDIQDVNKIMNCTTKDQVLALIIKYQNKKTFREIKLPKNSS
jgi:hypothetical protein